MTPVEVAVAIADSISDPILLIDNWGLLAGANTMASVLIGFPKATLIGKRLTDLIEGDRAAVTAKLRSWRRSVEPIPGILTIRTVNGGRKLICEGSALRIGDSDSEHLVIIRCSEPEGATQRFTALEDKIQALDREIHERQQIENALRDSEQRFRGIFENASDAMIVANDDGLIVEANPAACELVGRSIDELSHLRVADLGALSLDKTEELWKDFIHSGTQHGTFPILRPDGEVREAEYNAVRDFVEGRHLSILRDVTERQRAAAERERQAEALARSNAELEQFAYVVSHDLQEPLRTISSFLQLTERRLASLLDAETTEYISLVKGAVYRLQRVILDLLEFSRLGRTEHQRHRVNLGKLVPSTLLTLRSSIEEAGAIVSVGPMPEVEGDPTRLHQLFLNLIGNALKFRRGKPEIQVCAERHGEEWVISVRDNGQGIEPEYFDRIFEPFRRLHGHEVPGSGIGLAICKRVAENHGGRIWVESELGIGSTFFVALPTRVDSLLPDASDTSAQ